MNIKGHEKIREFLSLSLERERVGHAYLFSGREGIGKRLVALEFILALLEGKGERKERIIKGIHPDFLEIGPDPEKNSILIEHIREAQAWLSLAPMEAKRKALLISDAHTMTHEASSAFLKTLEEPPQHSTIILITSQTHRLLPTILSRCQILRFSPLSDEEVMEILVEQGIPRKEAQEIAPLAQGSVTFALDLARGKGRDLYERAKALMKGDLSPLSVVEDGKWKKDRGEVLKYLGFLRILLKREMEKKTPSPSLWEKHKLLARLEENLYQYNLNAQLTLEYLELKWRRLESKR